MSFAREKEYLSALNSVLTDKSEEADETLAFPAVSSPQQREITEEAKLRYTVFNSAWKQIHDRVLVSLQYTIFRVFTDGL